MKVFACVITAAVAAATPMDAVREEVESSPAFKSNVEKAASALCIGAVDKAQCASFIGDAVFCLQLVKNSEKFKTVDGAKQQMKSCASLDSRIPETKLLQVVGASFLQVREQPKAEDKLAKEMTHDLEMNFNKIAPFGKEDTARELQDHAAKTQDTLVDAVENAEVAEIKRAVFRALTRLRAAAIKEFDTIARLETQAIDAYNDAHHFRGENALTHLHEDEAPIETDKLKSFH